MRIHFALHLVAALVVAVVVAASTILAASPCDTQSNSATFDIAVQNSNGNIPTPTTSSVSTSLSNYFGIDSAAFTVAADTTNPARTDCPGAGTTTGCLHFSASVVPTGVHRNGNRVNYTAIALEAMLSQLFRNSTSASDLDLGYTLDALGWDTVLVSSPSCATENAVNILSSAGALSTAPPSQIPVGLNLSSCSFFTVSGVSPAANKADENGKQAQALLSAFAAATTGTVSFLGQPEPNSASSSSSSSDQQQTPQSQSRCCIGAGQNYSDGSQLTEAQAIAMNRLAMALNDNNTVTSAVINALTLRGKLSAIAPKSQLSVSSNAPQPSQCPMLHGSGNPTPVAPLALVVRFNCDGGSNSDSLTSSFVNGRVQDADNVSDQLVNKFPSIFSYVPMSLLPGGGSSSSLRYGGGKKMYINSTFVNSTATWAGAMERICGVLLFANLANTGAPFATLDQILGCAQSWAAANAGDYVAPAKPKKVTPPLFLYSFIVTAVLFILTVAYVYKFQPPSRRYDFPNQHLAAAMLDESEQAQREMEAAVNDDGDHSKGTATAARKTPQAADDTGSSAYVAYKDTNLTAAREREVEGQKVFAM